MLKTFASAYEYFTKMLTHLPELYNIEKFTIKSFLIFFVFALILFFTELVGFSISIDDEHNAIRTTFEGWTEQGRWTNYLFFTYIFPRQIIPYLPHLIFVFFITLSYLFVMRAHDLKISFYSYLLFPLFCAFPIWGFVAEFYANIAVTGLGMLFVSIATWLFRWFVFTPLANNVKFSYHNFSYILLLQIILITMAIGIYQVFIFVFFSMGIGITILSSMTNKIKLSKIIIACTFLCLLSCVSLVIYYIINFIAIHSSNLLSSEYINSFYQPHVFFSAPFEIAVKVLKQTIMVYWGSTELYGSSLNAIGLLLLLGITVCIFNNRSANYFLYKLIIFGLVGMMIIIPFTLHFVSAGDTPLRSLVGVPYVLWFFGLLTLMSSRKIIRGIGVLLLIIGIFQMLYTNSLYAASRQFIEKHDEMLALSIYQRIVDVHPNFDIKKTYPIYFYGAKSTKTVYPKVKSTTMGESFFSAEEGNPSRMLIYMYLIGFNNFIFADITPDQQNILISHIKTMPIWPAMGSVQVVADITIVNLGKNIDDAYFPM